MYYDKETREKFESLYKGNKSYWQTDLTFLESMILARYCYKCLSIYLYSIKDRNLIL